MLAKKLPDDLFGDEILVATGKAAELNRWYVRQFPSSGDDDLLPDEYKGCYRSLNPTDPRRPVIRVVAVATDRIYARELTAVLSHELTHCVFAIFKAKGVPIKRKNDEVFAYYHEWLCKQAWKILGA